MAGRKKTVKKDEFAAIGIYKDETDTYRWISELPMNKCLFLLLEVWKALAVAAVIILIFAALISVRSFEAFTGTAGAILLALAIVYVLSIPAYWIVAKANNNMYTVLFEMDDDGIDHIQIKSEKAKGLELLTTLAGIVTQNRTTTAAAALSAGGGSLYTDFSTVRKIKADPQKQLILLKSRFFTNQVYTQPENYEFILKYLQDHCPEAGVQITE